MSTEQTQPENNEQPQQQEAINGDAANAVDQVLSKIDFDKISKDDVFSDIMQNSRIFAFRLMVGAAVLEQLILRERAKADGAELQPNEVVNPPAGEESQDQPDLTVVRDEEAK